MTNFTSQSIIKNICIVILLQLSVLCFGVPLIKSGGKKDYTGYSLLRFTPTTNEQLHYLERLWTDSENSDFHLDIWQPPGILNKHVDALVSPSEKDGFKERMHSLGLETFTEIQDLERLIEHENVEENEVSRSLLDLDVVSRWGFRARMQPTSTFRLDRFNRFAVMQAHLEELARKYPTLISLETIGRTYENRPILMAKITGRPVAAGSGAKPAMFLDAGIHAREWVAPATAMYMIETLVTRYNLDTKIRNMVDKTDWYIVPVLNPDGYEYSHESDRMWRKNRSPARANSRRSSLFGGSRTCPGVDLNRNFDWHWATVGSSSYECENTYHGTHAFSEPETRAVRDFILKNKHKIKGYMSFHSYSQMWLVPYGHRSGSYAADHYSKTMPLARKASRGLKAVHGTRYSVGTGADLLYSAGGGSEDWAKGVADVEYAFLLELRPNGDVWSNGFILSRSQIVPTAEETWAGVMVVAEHIQRQYPVRLAAGNGGRPVGFTPITRAPTFFTLAPRTTSTQTPEEGSVTCDNPGVTDRSRLCTWWRILNRCSEPNIGNAVCIKSCCDAKANGAGLRVRVGRRNG